MSKSKEAPWLQCPSCDEDLIQATHRARYDHNGELVEHRDGCRCPWCEWMWYDSDPIVTCQCGAAACVRIDDDRAYASEV